MGSSGFTRNVGEEQNELLLFTKPRSSKDFGTNAALGLNARNLEENKMLH